MKHNPKTTAAISSAPIIGNLFSTPVRVRKAQRIISEKLKSLGQFDQNSTFKHLLHAAKGVLTLYIEQIQTCCATVTIGGIFLVLIFVFFTQLAEYGW